jgi:trans-aconitate methyltransferase
MFNTAVNGMDDYNLVGVSALRSIQAAFLSTTIESIGRVMDYGCGHGRVARQLRAFLPNAEMFFADIDKGGTQFCAEQFRGTAVPAYEDLEKLALPSGMDLIWVGSVFTHLDHKRIVLLFDALIAALNPKGILVATFRGRHMYRTMKADTRPAEVEKWKPLLAQFEATGIAYQSYGIPAYGDWGLSLTSVESVIALAHKHADVRLVGYSETGWSGVHDVAAWARIPA